MKSTALSLFLMAIITLTQVQRTLYDFLPGNLNPKRGYIIGIPTTAETEGLLAVSSGDVVFCKPQRHPYRHHIFALE